MLYVQFPTSHTVHYYELNENTHRHIQTLLHTDGHRGIACIILSEKFVLQLLVQNNFPHCYMCVRKIQ
jgi:hypothetical protein